MCVCVCVRACVRACERARVCMRACECEYACARACVFVRALALRRVQVWRRRCDALSVGWLASPRAESMCLDGARGRLRGLHGCGCMLRARLVLSARSGRCTRGPPVSARQTRTGTATRAPARRRAALAHCRLCATRTRTSGLPTCEHLRGQQGHAPSQSALHVVCSGRALLSESLARS